MDAAPSLTWEFPTPTGRNHLGLDAGPMWGAPTARARPHPGRNRQGAIATSGGPRRRPVVFGTAPPAFGAGPPAGSRQLPTVPVASGGRLIYGASVKRTVTLDIAGAKYRLITDADEAQLRRLAEVVNERIVGLGEKAARSASSEQLLAVVALGLADDLLAAEARREQLELTTRRAISRAIARIDQRLAADMSAADAPTEP